MKHVRSLADQAFLIAITLIDNCDHLPSIQLLTEAVDHATDWVNANRLNSGGRHGEIDPVERVDIPADAVLERVGLFFAIDTDLAWGDR